MKVFVLTVLTCACVYAVNSSKILVITSMPAHSHFSLAFRFAKELADREHEVTFVNPFPQKTPIKNLRDIPIVDAVPYLEEFRKTFLTSTQSLGPLWNTMIHVTLGPDITELALNSTNLQNLLNSDESFDIVIIEHFVNEALVGIALHFGAPVILLAPVPSCYANNFIFGNPSPSSYVPDILGSNTKHMNFWQRLSNFLSLNLHDLIREVFYMPKQRALFKKYIKTDLELDDVLHNISLIFTTSHPSVNEAVPHLPNIVEIGGYHIFPPKKLPPDLQQFFDNAKEGVILFSMGSNVKSKDLTLNVRKAILDSFSKIKVKVLWKFETDLSEAPENVKIMKWLPQQDILGHPNIRGFITHGGLLSSIEAIYFGVPIIGIPVFGDQRNNIAAAVDNGYGIGVFLEDLTEETFSAALNQILNNPKYRENARQRSKVMHDQPLTPIDLAVYWIEHVIRHQGAPFHRSAGTDLKWYQREMIDIFAFLGFVLISLMITVYIILKKLYSIICVRKETKLKKQ